MLLVLLVLVLVLVLVLLAAAAAVVVVVMVVVVQRSLQPQHPPPLPSPTPTLHQRRAARGSGGGQGVCRRMIDVRGGGEFVEVGGGVSPDADTAPAPASDSAANAVVELRSGQTTEHVRRWLAGVTRGTAGGRGAEMGGEAYVERGVTSLATIAEGRPSTISRGSVCKSGMKQGESLHSALLEQICHSKILV